MVNKNDRWSALSMSDRADLIKLYVNNGITSLDTIKKDYNSFGSGGPKEDAPTLEEFLQAKADSTRVAAHEKSLSRNEGIEIVYPLSEGRKVANQNFVAEYYDLDPEFIGPVVITHKSVRPAYEQAVKELENNCEYGLNCIGTATDNYPEDSREVSNSSFRENFDTKGFYVVPFEEKLPGDIVQQGGHSVIFDSYKREPHPLITGAYGAEYPVYNYSNGSIGSANYRKQKRYPFETPIVYRYKGTPTLIQQWTNEYNEKYKKANGGKINSFGDGGDTEKPWYQKISKGLIESLADSKDAKIGAVGAQQVRDLYSKGKNEEAQKLAEQYAKANTTGISLASGALSSSLVSDLILGEVLTATDTLIEGDASNLGYNLVSNISGEVLGHGIGKLLSKVYPKISKEATAKIEALLKRFPEGVESVSSVSKELRDRLIKEGVDPEILTKSNLRKMVYLRGMDLLESDAPAKFAGRTNSKATNTYNLYHNTDGQIRQVGYVAATPEDGVGKINMIENVTEYTPDRVKGVSELGYNTVIKDIGASRNGSVLMQPNKTKRVLDKYSDKEIISSDGEWFDGNKYVGGNPVFQLNSPTYDVPIKYLDDFSVEGLDDSGMFLFDFTKGPLLKNGGKLNKK